MRLSKKRRGNMTNYANEIWKQVLGYEGLYSVSSLGRLRKEFKSNNCRAGYITTGCKDKHYVRVSLRKNGIRKNINIHVLVAEAFLGKRPHGLYVNHKDGNKRNNSINNLEYVTPRENILQSVKAGTHPKGSRIAQAKLNEKDVIEVIKLLSSHHSCESISKKFCVSRTAINRIKLGKTWRHITLRRAGGE